MKNFKTKADKFNEVFRLMNCFKTMRVFYLPSFKSNVYECLSESEQELYNLLWKENLQINRERLNTSFTKGNDIKYDNLIEKAFNLLEKSFEEYISDSNGQISFTNRVEHTLESELEKIYSLKDNFSKLPEYSEEFFNIGTDMEVPEIGVVQKIEPKLNDSGYISNYIGDFEFYLTDKLDLEEGLYIFPKLDNVRFDIKKSYDTNQSLILSISLDSEEENKLLEIMKPYINDYESQIKEYNYSNENIRYSIYDVYSMNELL